MNKSQHSPRLKCKGTDNAVPNLVEQVEVEDKSKSREQKLHFETASSAYKRGISEEKTRCLEFIKQRKYVWNEEKFGSVKNHKMFDLFVEELILELKKELLGDAK